MRANSYKMQQRQNEEADQIPADTALQVFPPETTFAKAAYEWNNALLIAAEKMWNRTT